VAGVGGRDLGSLRVAPLPVIERHQAPAWFVHTRQLAAFVGLIPSEYSTGGGPITKAGDGHARRALVEAAWAYRYPAKVSVHLQRRVERCANPIRAIAWKTQVRRGKR
jgi:transposase